MAGSAFFARAETHADRGNTTEAERRDFSNPAGGPAENPGMEDPVHSGTFAEEIAPMKKESADRFREPAAAFGEDRAGPAAQSIAARYPQLTRPGCLSAKRSTRYKADPDVPRFLTPA
jgi:hypothetical protein